MKIKNLLFIIFCGALFGLAGIQNASAATIVTCYNNCSPTYTNVVGVYTLDLQCNAASPTSYTAQLTVNGVAGSVNTKYCACTYTGPVGPWAPACYATGTWNTPSGSNATINNTAAGYTGSVVYSCSNGVYSYVSQSCTALPPTLSTSVSPSSIAYNSSATISWSSANTNSCYGYSAGSAGATWNNGVWNAIATSGSASTGVLSSTSSFYIYCAGKNGTNVFSSPYPMTVTVAAPPPTLSTSVSPSSIAYNSSATISWSSANTNSCYGYSAGSAGATWNNGVWNAIATSGSASTGVLSSTTSFYIYCIGKNGTNVFSSPYPMTVTVAAPPYNYTFNSNGGTPSYATKTQTAGTSVTSPGSPTRTGYTFTGWSPALPTTMPVGGGGTTAQWAVNNYTVSASAGVGGTISPASQTVSSGGSTTFTVTPNAGYTASASGCGGSLSGTTYTTGAITGACTVSATYTLINVFPTPPTISGPTTLTTGQSGTYSFVSTDPQGQQVTYAVDWNSDGTDLWMPYGSVPPPGGMTYVNSGVSQSASKSWSTPGTYTVRVLAQDYSGNNSAWATYTITVSDPQPCTAGVVDSSGSWAPTCSTSATCLTPPSPAQLTNQTGIQVGICPTPGYTGNAYRSCSTATITCTPATLCGDNICNGSETILTCPADCKGRYQQF